MMILIFVENETINKCSFGVLVPGASPNLTSGGYTEEACITWPNCRNIVLYWQVSLKFDKMKLIPNMVMMYLFRFACTKCISSFFMFT